MARALVTGAAGFIGSTLTERLIDMGHEVVGIDSFTDFYNGGLKKKNISQSLSSSRFRLIDKDILDTDIESLGTFDYVFHLASEPGVPESWGMFDAYTKSNIAATQKLLEGLKSAKISKLVHSSSSSVYGITNRIMSEETTPMPYSPYGATKLAAEHLCNIYNKNYDLPTISLRYFAVYGPRQRPDMPIAQFIYSMLTDKHVIVDGDGSEARDFTYVDDVVDATIKAAESDVSGQVMNIGTGQAVSIKNILGVLKEISGDEINVEYKRNGKRLGEVDYTQADISRATRLLGFSPKVGIREGLSREFEYMKHNLRFYSGPSKDKTMSFPVDDWFTMKRSLP